MGARVKFDAALHRCVPITWCHAEDLALKFNPPAFANIHGSSATECAETANDLMQPYARFCAMRQPPLMSKRPDLPPLLNFLETAIT